MESQVQAGERRQPAAALLQRDTVLGMLNLLVSLSCAESKTGRMDGRDRVPATYLWCAPAHPAWPSSPSSQAGAEVSSWTDRYVPYILGRIEWKLSKLCPAASLHSESTR